jgi:putative phosphoesterase
MRVGLLSDVHGNLPALEAVLAELGRRGVQRVWNLGDQVGVGGRGDDCVRRLAARCEVNLRGNYDRKVLAFPQRKDRWKRTKKPEKYRNFRDSWRNLSRRCRRLLAEEPPDRRLRVEGWRVLLVHGSPVSDNEVLGADLDEGRVAELARLAGADLLACGHSHEAFIRRGGGLWVVNPGSVGLPPAGGRGASFAVVEFTPTAIEAELAIVKYPTPKP